MTPAPAETWSDERSTSPSAVRRESESTTWAPAAGGGPRVGGAAPRHGAAHQARVATLRHDGRALGRADAQHRRDLLRRPRPDHRDRTAGPPPRPVRLERRPHVVVDEHVTLADHVPQRVDEGHRCATLPRDGARDGLHAGGDADQVRARRGGRRGLGAQAPGRQARAARHRPRRRRDRPSRPRQDGDRARGHRGRRLRPRPRRADDRVAPARRRRGARGGRRRVRLRRRRLGHGHRQGRQPRDHPPGAGDGLREPADRRGPQAAGAAQAPSRDPDHLGHGQRGDHRRRARHPRTQGQDRDLPPLHAPEPGDRRPGADAHARARGHRLGRVSTSSATPPSPTSRSRTTPGPGPSHPTTARPTRAPTRSPTSGPRRRSSTAAPTSGARSTTPRTSRRAAS